MIKILKSVKRFAANLMAKILNIFYNRTPFIVTGAYGIKYSCYRRSALDAHIIKDGILPEYLLNTLDLKLPKESVIFDIGANVGYVSFVLAKKYAEFGEVHAFEPDSSNIKQFERNLELNASKNLYLHKCALQDNEGIHELRFNIRRLIDADKNENRGISTIANVELGKVDVKIVPASTIDKQVAELDLNRLDLIKIDVEGAEYLVIKGGIRAINRFRPIIQYEYSRVLDGLSNSRNAIEAYELIKSLGYEQFIIKNESELIMIREFDMQMGDTNILCFPK